jgi:hypothetical protein
MTEIYRRNLILHVHGQPTSHQPAGRQDITAQLTGLCLEFSAEPAGLCALLSPDLDSRANFGSSY